MEKKVRIHYHVPSEVNENIKTNAKYFVLSSSSATELKNFSLQSERYSKSNLFLRLPNFSFFLEIFSIVP